MKEHADTTYNQTLPIENPIKQLECKVRFNHR